MGDRSTEYGRLERNGSREYWRDKAEGLACELDSAIEVMAARVWGSCDTTTLGEWLLLNYRYHKAVMAGMGDSLCTPTPTETDGKP